VLSSTCGFIALLFHRYVVSSLCGVISNLM
jgi:hypothetical protein